MSEIREDEYLESDLRLEDRILTKKLSEDAEQHARTPLRLCEALDAITTELDRSMIHQEGFSSLHEAYAVIAEEVDEVWDICKMKRKNRSALALRKELIQVATMAVKGLLNIDKFVGGDV
jgi:hypothetical protein